MTIVAGATNVIDKITRNSFIMVVNEALCYGNKLNHSLINPNQLRCYVTMFWNNRFSPNRDICLEKCEGNTIDPIPDSTKIVFRSHVLMEEELRTLPHIEVTYGSEWNPNTVRLGKVSTDNNINAFHSQQHTLVITLLRQGDIFIRIMTQTRLYYIQ